MSFTESVKTCFNKYVTFKGRATRSEYWWFTICATVLIILLPLLVFALFNAEAMLFAYAALVLAFYLPMWSVTVRRLHDTNHSGWWILCPVYPYILMFIKGSEGENNYGTGENQCQLPCPICSELVDANLKTCPYCGEPTNFKLAEKNSGIDRKVAIGMLALCGLMLIGGIAFSFSDDSTKIGGGYDLSEYEDYDLEEAVEAEVVEEVEIDDIDYPEYSSSAVPDLSEGAFIQEFDGTIDEYPIHMTLDLRNIDNYDRCEITGNYRYTSSGNGVLRLYGEKRKEHLILKEYDNEGNCTGTFDGEFSIYGNLAFFEYEGTFTTSAGESYRFYVSTLN